MKRVKYLSILFIITFALIGGAFAYWTEELTVSGAVTTGQFDVLITRADCPNADGRTFWASHPYEGKEILPHVTGGGEILDGGKKARLWADNIYPRPMTHYQNWQLNITNNGSIPMKLESVEFNSAGSGNVWNYLRGTLHLTIYDQEIHNNNVVYSESANNFKFENIAGEIEDIMSGITVKPKHIVRHSIIFNLPPEADNDTQGEEVDFTLKFNWVQWNK